MVDTGRARRALHPHETKALNYGHPGTATYDPQTHTWVFLRQHQPQLLDNGDDLAPDGLHGFQLVHERVLGVGEGQISSSAAVKEDFFRPWGRVTLLKQIPDAAFISKNLSSLIHVPKAQLDNEPKTRPFGNLLAFGGVRKSSKERPRKNVLRQLIAAFPTGLAGEDLQLVGLEAENILLESRTGPDRVHRVPCLGHHAAGRLSNSAEQIQHISRAKLAHQMRFLVVRSSGTDILRPGMLNSQYPEQGTSSNILAKSQSLLDPCLVLTIPSSRTGGQPHAYAAFHPQDQKLVVIVDTHGQWSRWKIEGRKPRTARVLYHATLQSFNVLRNVESQTALRGSPQHFDGWHRICWVLGAKGTKPHILVCNRRSAAVFDQVGGLLGHVDMRLGPLSHRNQILDVKICESRPFLILILTTSRLMIFSSLYDRDQAIYRPEPLELLCSWNHFRDPSDLNLSMSCLEFPQGMLLLLK